MKSKCPHGSGSGFKKFKDAAKAVAYAQKLYQENIEYLQSQFEKFAKGEDLKAKVGAFYPKVEVTIKERSQTDSRSSYGFISHPGIYSTTITRPDFFEKYFTKQFEQLIKNHGISIKIGMSDQAIPIHFALGMDNHLEGLLTPERLQLLPNLFDLPDLEKMDDVIANGVHEPQLGEDKPLSLFTAPRVDISLQRLRHYTATNPEHFQNFVIFTNYQFYVEQFIELANEMMNGVSGYDAFVQPGNVMTYPEEDERANEPPLTPPLKRLPQMPAYHLKRPDGAGITLINIGVGPSNAKTITDHVAVMRPHAWLMLGHCAGLRNSQRLGDYVFAHAYMREDNVLDKDLPISVPLPALAEIQQGLEQATAEVTGLQDYEVKKIMRTGTVATVDDRNWELRDYKDPIRRLSQSRAVALDMESATIAANGFRFRVPYGTLLCVSDKPLHGELKLPGMADDFYRQRVDQHLKIGLRAMELLRDVGLERLHSRKLRSFHEVAFQ